MITELEFKSLSAQGYNRIPLMVEAFADLLELDRDRVPVSGDRVGNTASASLPISLAMSDDERPLERGDIVVMVTAGAGVNAVVMVQRWYR